MSPINSAINEQKESFRKKAIAVIIGAIGWLFFLNGLAILINTVVGVDAWPGYVGLGAILLFIALVKR